MPDSLFYKLFDVVEENGNDFILLIIEFNFLIFNSKIKIKNRVHIIHEKELLKILMDNGSIETIAITSDFTHGIHFVKVVH